MGFKPRRKRPQPDIPWSDGHNPMVVLICRPQGPGPAVWPKNPRRVFALAGDVKSRRLVEYAWVTPHIDDPDNWTTGVDQTQAMRLLNAWEVQAAFYAAMDQAHEEGEPLYDFEFRIVLAEEPTKTLNVRKILRAHDIDPDSAGD